MLPFRIRRARTEGDLRSAVWIRQLAYSRHVPEFAATLVDPEPEDGAAGVAILLAESNLDRSPLGSMRILTNQFEPLALERSIALPEWLRARRLAEATRLAVTHSPQGPLVKLALIKACYHYCVRANVDWMVVAGRAPFDRQYIDLLFDEVYPGLGYVPMQHAGNRPHRVLKFEVHTAEQRWSEARHPLFNFIFRTEHAEIDVDTNVSDAATR